MTFDASVRGGESSFSFRRDTSADAPRDAESLMVLLEQKDREISSLKQDVRVFQEREQLIHEGIEKASECDIRSFLKVIDSPAKTTFREDEPIRRLRSEFVHMVNQQASQEQQAVEETSMLRNELADMRMKYDGLHSSLILNAEALRDNANKLPLSDAGNTFAHRPSTETQRPTDVAQWQETIDSLRHALEEEQRRSRALEQRLHDNCNVVRRGSKVCNGHDAATSDGLDEHVLRDNDDSADDVVRYMDDDDEEEHREDATTAPRFGFAASLEWARVQKNVGELDEMKNTVRTRAQADRKEISKLHDLVNTLRTQNTALHKERLDLLAQLRLVCDDEGVPEQQRTSQSQIDSIAAENLQCSASQSSNREMHQRLDSEDVVHAVEQVECHQVGTLEQDCTQLVQPWQVDEKAKSHKDADTPAEQVQAENAWLLEKCAEANARVTHLEAVVAEERSEKEVQLGRVSTLEGLLQVEIRAKMSCCDQMDGRHSARQRKEDVVRRQMEEHMEELAVRLEKDKTAHKQPEDGVEDVAVQLEKEKAAHRRMAEEMKGFTARLEKKRAACKRMAEEIESLTLELEDERSARKRMADQLEDAAARLEKQEEAFKQLQKEMTKSEALMEELSLARTQMQEEILSTVTQLEAEKTERAHVQLEMVGAAAQLAAEKMERARMQEEMADAVARLEKEKEERAQMLEDMADAVARLEEEKVARTQVQGEMDYTMAQFEEKKLACTRLQGEVEDAVAQLKKENLARAQLKWEMEYTGAQLEKEKVARAQMQEEMADTVVQLEKEKVARTQLKGEMEYAVAQLEKEKLALAQVQEEMEYAVAQSEKEMVARAQVQGEMEFAVAQLKEEKLTRAQMQEKMDYAVAQFEREKVARAHTLLEMDDAAAQLGKGEEAREQLQKRLDDTLSQLETEMAAHAELQREMEAVVAQLEKEEEEKLARQQIKEEMESAVAQFESGKIERAQMQGELQTAVAQLDTEKKAHSQVQEEMKDVMVQLEAQKVAHAQIHETMENAVAQLEAEKAARAQMREEMEDVVAQLESQKEAHAEMQETMENAVAQLETEKAVRAQMQEEMEDTMGQLEAKKVAHAQMLQEMENAVSQWKTEKLARAQVQEEMLNMTARFEQQEERAEQVMAQRLEKAMLKKDNEMREMEENMQRLSEIVQNDHARAPQGDVMQWLEDEMLQKENALQKIDEAPCMFDDAKRENERALEHIRDVVTRGKPEPAVDKSNAHDALDAASHGKPSVAQQQVADANAELSALRQILQTTEASKLATEVDLEHESRIRKTHEDELDDVRATLQREVVAREELETNLRRCTRRHALEIQSLRDQLAVEMQAKEDACAHAAQITRVRQLVAQETQAKEDALHECDVLRRRLNEEIHALERRLSAERTEHSVAKGELQKARERDEDTLSREELRVELSDARRTIKTLLDTQEEMRERTVEAERARETASMLQAQHKEQEEERQRDQDLVADLRRNVIDLEQSLEKERRQAMDSDALLEEMRNAQKVAGATTRGTRDKIELHERLGEIEKEHDTAAAALGKRRKDDVPARDMCGATGTFTMHHGLQHLRAELRREQKRREDSQKELNRLTATKLTCEEKLRASQAKNSLLEAGVQELRERMGKVEQHDSTASQVASSTQVMELFNRFQEYVSRTDAMLTNNEREIKSLRNEVDTLTCAKHYPQSVSEESTLCLSDARQQKASQDVDLRRVAHSEDEDESDYEERVALQKQIEHYAKLLDEKQEMGAKVAELKAKLRVMRVTTKQSQATWWEMEENRRKCEEKLDESLHELEMTQQLLHDEKRTAAALQHARDDFVRCCTHYKHELDCTRNRYEVERNQRAECEKRLQEERAKLHRTELHVAQLEHSSRQLENDRNVERVRAAHLENSLRQVENARNMERLHVAQVEQTSRHAENEHNSERRRAAQLEQLLRKVENERNAERVRCAELEDRLLRATAEYSARAQALDSRISSLQLGHEIKGNDTGHNISRGVDACATNNATTRSHALRRRAGDVVEDGRRLVRDADCKLLIESADACTKKNRATSTFVTTATALQPHNLPSPLGAHNSSTVTLRAPPPSSSTTAPVLPRKPTPLITDGLASVENCPPSLATTTALRKAGSYRGVSSGRIPLGGRLNDELPSVREEFNNKKREVEVQRLLGDSDRFHSMPPLYRSHGHVGSRTSGRSSRQGAAIKMRLAARQLRTMVDDVRNFASDV